MKKTLADYQREDRTREDYKRRFKERQGWIDRTMADHDLTPAARLIGARLGLHKNLDTGQCNPGYGTLGKESGYPVRSAMRAIAELESKGRIGATRTEGGGKSNSYTLIPYPPKAEQPVSPQHGSSDTTRVTTHPCQTAHWTRVTTAPEL
jgi:hypothetical protein